jgi:hypothetical protein
MMIGFLSGEDSREFSLLGGLEPDGVWVVDFLATFFVFKTV